MCNCTFDTICHDCELDQAEAFSVALLGIGQDDIDYDYDE